MRFTKLALTVLIVCITISCVDDDDNGNVIEGESNTITDLLVGNDDYSTLLAALQQTGLNATLSGSGTFTLFAPNNAAFDTFLNGTALEDINNDLLSQILSNHVLNTTITSTDFITGYITTLATEESSNTNISLYVDVAATTTLNGQSTITDFDITANNGIIHPIDTVIELPTLATFVATNPSLTTLFTALTNDGNTAFTDLLTNVELDFTVLAPTNDAFETFLDGSTLDEIDADLLAQLLSNHLVPGTVAISTTLTNSYLNTAAIYNNQEDAPISLYVNTDNGITLNGNSTIILADIVAVNGVLQVVDGIIDLPEITTFTTIDPNFSLLTEAFTANPSFEYVTLLQTPNDTQPAPFTLFAPTNDAFEDLLLDLELETISEIPTATLSTALDLHLITASNVRAIDFTTLNGTPVTTSGGTNVTIQGDPVAIIDPDGEENLVVITDIQTTNGVIQSVSRVLRDL